MQSSAEKCTRSGQENVEETCREVHMILFCNFVTVLVSSAQRYHDSCILFKGQTSPLIRQNNNRVDLSSSKHSESSIISVDRFSLPNTRFDGNITYPVTLAQGTKSQKKSKLKVLLSPRNPYEEFHKLFTDIPKEEFPINDYSCALSREILLHGRLFLSQNWLCFYSNIFGWETVVKLELRKVKSIARARTAYMFPNAILIRTEKKKYLFCSFLMRDAAHKLLSTIWQESTNTKPDSGVEEVSANGDQDEEESEALEEIAEYDDTEIPVITQEMTTPTTDPALWNLKKHHRTVSCPNTPLSRHSSVDESPEITTHRSHYKDHQTRRRSLSLSYLGKCIGKIAATSWALIHYLYNCFPSFEWLKRNRLNADVLLLFSSIFLIFLFISTYVLMNRISKLEDRFYQPVPTSNQYLISDKKSDENWSELLKEQETLLRQKTERFSEALSGLILSVENVSKSLLNQGSIKVKSDQR
ncbi:GRAM domain-containing protein 2B-like isoform X2 [Dendronephthya gigantea]|uniref:GRAM domain-containing protein 2B-like isoform X2 n=1 Tax=Dendronephthya gigantea TaxID=151771 RepID=UPI001068FFB2|nr:GRAM domain-containing protein 2B-like isoform X2 [Dendronephthya gigantea]